MRLTQEYLNERHAYWKNRLGSSGIWDESKFGDITIVIRPPCKSYNGLFIRRYLKVNGKRKLVDRIFIYNNVEDFDPAFLDRVLVHEMIHQYIYQARIKDTSSHGKVFRDLMKRINSAMCGELQINIRDTNPGVPLKRTERKRHLLLIMHLKNGTSFCCVVNPGKIINFEKMVRKNRKALGIAEYYWGISENPYFNGYSRCTTRLHGIRKSRQEMEGFCASYGVRAMDLNVLTDL